MKCYECEINEATERCEPPLCKPCHDKHFKDIPVSREDEINGDIIKQKASVVANGLLSKLSSDNQDIKTYTSYDIATLWYNNHQGLPKTWINEEEHKALLNQKDKDHEKEIQRLKDERQKWENKYKKVAIYLALK